MNIPISHEQTKTNTTTTTSIEVKTQTTIRTVTNQVVSKSSPNPDSTMDITHSDASNNFSLTTKTKENVSITTKTSQAAASSSSSQTVVVQNCSQQTATGAVAVSGGSPGAAAIPVAHLNPAVGSANLDANSISAHSIASASIPQATHSNTGPGSGTTSQSSNNSSDLPPYHASLGLVNIGGQDLAKSCSDVASEVVHNLTQDLEDVNLAASQNLEEELIAEQQKQQQIKEKQKRVDGADVGCVEEKNNQEECSAQLGNSENSPQIQNFNENKIPSYSSVSSLNTNATIGWR